MVMVVSDTRCCKKLFAFLVLVMCVTFEFGVLFDRTVHSKLCDFRNVCGLLSGNCIGKHILLGHIFVMEDFVCLSCCLKMTDTANESFFKPTQQSIKIIIHKSLIPNVCVSMLFLSSGDC